MAVHLCHACKDLPCPPAHLMCGGCWRRVPGALKAAVYRAYVPGQEERTVRPSAAWFAAARAAIRAAREGAAPGGGERAA